jgi:hypothetical protein
MTNRDISQSINKIRNIFISDTSLAEKMLGEIRSAEESLYSRGAADKDVSKPFKQISQLLRASPFYYYDSLL